MVNQTPEQISRDQIDRRLIEAGWVVVDKNKIDFTKGDGIAVREYPTDDGGEIDYALFVDKKAVGVIEAKKDDDGFRITTVEEQSNEYANSKLKHIKNEPLNFIYEATGVLTRFTDKRDPKPRSRQIFSFHRPETLRSYLKEGQSLRGRLKDIPVLDMGALRDCQFNAINNLEKSFKEFKPRALIQMSTGAGKTFTAITFVYRLLKFAKAKRILFLVDTKNLGEQAEQEFMAFQPSDDNRKFTELYNVTRLKSKNIPTDSQVYISTIQRLYSVLKGEELDESLEISNPNEAAQPLKQPAEIAYNSKVPIEFFDFVIVDECHRSIYNLWKQVLDYYDSFLIGLTATPDKRTFGFFNQNVVSEYSYTQAVADGVNVGHDIYLIETEVTQKGSKIQAKEFVDKREKQTRKMRWEQVDDEIEYTGKQLDRDVVNPNQIRLIVKTFKDKLPEIFPGRTEVPKTLIFAKTDSHADDIINIVREEFGEGNDFCKKITYQTEEDPKSILASFRNQYNPRIAVTVDMIATGTDVKPLECLLFMRDVRSRNYYAQMLGRGARVLNADDLKRVSPSAKSAKTHFVVIDAVGVSTSCKTDVKPLEKKKSVPLKDLLNQMLMGSTEEDVYSSVASRLERLDKEITDVERKQFEKLTNGKTIKTLVHEVIDAQDFEKHFEEAVQQFHLPDDKEPTEKQIEEVKEKYVDKVRSTLNGELVEFLVKARQDHDQIIDKLNPDTLLYAGASANQTENAKKIIEEFESFIKKHQDEIDALKIIYNQHHKMNGVTFAMIKDLKETLILKKPNLMPLRVFEAYAHFEKKKPKTPLSELTAIVALIRKVAQIDESLIDYESVVDKNFQKWIFGKHAGVSQKFSEAQMAWLRMIKEHISTSFQIERDDLEMSPFDAQGGLGKMYELFGNQMDSVLSEMNEALVA